MDKWKETTVGIFCPFLYGKGLPEVQRKLGSIPVVSSAGITGSHNKALIETGGIVIGRKGTVGKLTLLNEPFWPIDTSFYIVDDPSERDLRFTFYLLKTLNLDKMNSDSAVPGLNRDNAHQRKVFIPNLYEQKAIAKVLGALDDKIELNRKMNATLEAMARALFKSWFVDFDPVHAKMAGKQPFGMDAATAALFPSKLTPSPLGDIPEGWFISSVGSEFNIIMGQSPPGETYNEDGNGLPFFQGRTDFGFRYPSRRIFCTQPNRIAESGDTLISVRAPVGDINMAFEKCILGRGVGSLRHKSKARSYTYYAINSIQLDIKAFEADGTVFGSINKQDVEKLSIISPSQEVIEKFENIVSHVDEKILLNTKEILELERIRDYLLPKLISGEIRIHDAEKMVEGI